MSEEVLEVQKDDLLEVNLIIKDGELTTLYAKSWAVDKDSGWLTLCLPRSDGSGDILRWINLNEITEFDVPWPAEDGDVQEVS